MILLYARYIATVFPLKSYIFGSWLSSSVNYIPFYIFIIVSVIYLWVGSIPLIFHYSGISYPYS